MYEGLKNYFCSLDKCPMNIRNFFRDEAGCFWLHFIEGQLKLSNEFVLKSETKKGAAFEIASLLTELQGAVQNRAQNNFIPSRANPLFEALSNEKKSEVKQEMKQFYSSLSAYLEKWSKSLDGNEIFAWMALTEVPDYAREIAPSLEYMIKHTKPDVIDSDAVFDETHYLQSYILDKLVAWNQEKTTSEDRWVEIFKTMKQQHKPLNQISLLVQYAMSIPGSSAEVERLFSKINDIWVPTKDNMKIETLEAYLNVQYNCNMSCSEYFKMIRNDKRLLAQVNSNEKYQNSAATQASTSSAPSQHVVIDSDNDDDNLDVSE